MYRRLIMTGASIIEIKKRKKVIETVQFGRTTERSTVDMATSAARILFELHIALRELSHASTTMKTLDIGPENNDECTRPIQCNSQNRVRIFVNVSIPVCFPTRDIKCSPLWRNLLTNSSSLRLSRLNQKSNPVHAFDHMRIHTAHTETPS